MHERDEVSRYAHRALFLTHQYIIQTRARQAAKRAHRDEQCIGIGVGKARHHPVAINTRGRHLVLHDDFDVFFERWYWRVNGCHFLAALDAAEPFFHQWLCLRRIDVACQNQNGIIWTIMVGKPCLHIIQRGRRQVFKAADRAMMIRVTNGEKRL